MRDLWGPGLQALKEAQAAMLALLESRGYEPIDTPLLEEADLFVRKSGGGLTGRLYTFVDPGGHRVSLRPEFTSSIIRHFVERQGELALPARWCYGGPVFRYEPAPEQGYRQFTQVGAELVGPSGSESDAEIIGLAWECLAQAGFTGGYLRIGHVGVLSALLESIGLSEAARLFILGNAPTLKGGRQSPEVLLRRAHELGLLRPSYHDGQELLAQVDPEAARQLLLSVLQETAPTPSGGRSPDQIVERLLRKMREADEPARVERALRLMAKLGAQEGPPQQVLPQVRRVFQEEGADTGPLEELEALLRRLGEAQGGMAITLDMGLARDISYYTGVIFEVVHEGASLGGGGRYDGLVKALGGQGDVPAMGFALALDRMVEALGHGQRR